jgi:hypothetical protein
MAIRRAVSGGDGGGPGHEGGAQIGLRDVDRVQAPAPGAAPGERGGHGHGQAQPPGHRRIQDRFPTWAISRDRSSR